MMNMNLFVGKSQSQRDSQLKCYQIAAEILLINMIIKMSYLFGFINVIKR